MAKSQKTRFDRISEDDAPSPAKKPPALKKIKPEKKARGSSPEETTLVLAFREKLDNDYYKTKLDWRGGQSAMTACNRDQARLDVEFRRDLLLYHDVTKNPKADLCFAKAYELGHANGHSEVASIFADLVELIK
jgi:hypothetical protein